MKIKIILSTASILAPFSALAQSDNLFGQGAYYNMMDMMNGWGGWFGWTFMVLSWIFIVLGIIALIKWIFKK